MNTLKKLELAESLESLSKLNAFDALPVIDEAASLIKSATAITETNAKFVENTAETDVALAVLRKATDERIAEILNAPNLTTEEGAKIYYVSNSGNDENDGLSPETAFATLDKANTILCDDSQKTYVLFERGGLWRGQLKTNKYITYSSYGEGDKPKIYSSPFNAGGSENAHLWKNIEGTDVWALQSDTFVKDVGTLIFNEGEIDAKKIILRSLHGETFDPKTTITKDLDFCHEWDTNTVYLVSEEGNPANRFASIEINLGKHAIVAATGVTIDNFCVKYTGAHGVGSGTVNNLTVQNCEFGWIGGSIHIPEHYIRFGNAVEIWGVCDDFTVINNYVYQVFDAGITQQFTIPDDKEMRQYNVLYSGNVLEYCNYSFEYWVTSSATNPSYIENFLIENNYMWYAGRGLCEQRPDHGNGSHINGWRFYDRNRAKKYAVRNNVMADSREYIMNIYSVWSTDEGNSMPIFNNNIVLVDTTATLGVAHQDTPDNTEWPETVAFNKDILEYTDVKLNGDIFGYISKLKF